MERYREGLPTRYEDLGLDVQQVIFSQFIEWAQQEGMAHGIDKLRKTMSTHNSYCFSNVRVSFGDWLSFQERFEKMLVGLSLYEQTKYGVLADYFSLDKKNREAIRQRAFGGDRRCWAMGNDKSSIRYNHILIPRNIWDEWKEEYSNRKPKK